MKKVAQYQCEKCDTFYDTSEIAESCENQHATDISIESIKCEPMTIAPSRLLIKMRMPTGSLISVRYTREHNKIWTTYQKLYLKHKNFWMIRIFLLKIVNDCKFSRPKQHNVCCKERSSKLFGMIINLQFSTNDKNNLVQQLMSIGSREPSGHLSSIVFLCKFWSLIDRTKLTRFKLNLLSSLSKKPKFLGEIIWQNAGNNFYGFKCF
jgi:hypothetical protein